jgi:hypothetical protein
MTLRDVIEVIVGLLVGSVGFFVVFGFLFVVAVSVAELGGKARRRMCRGRSLRLEQYRAEQALHDIRREAIRDLLETARVQRYANDDPEIIDGTAVEIRQ